MLHTKFEHNAVQISELLELSTIILLTYLFCLQSAIQHIILLHLLQKPLGSGLIGHIQSHKELCKATRVPQIAWPTQSPAVTTMKYQVRRRTVTSRE